MAKDDDLLYCNVCGNIYYWRDGTKLVCRCGNTREIAREPRAESPVIEETGEYDFKNKAASRRVVFRYLETMHDRKLIKDFPEMKVLILTSPEALDFKQILHPLGFKNENVTIIERDRKAFGAICNNPIFKDCRKLNMELIDYIEIMQYDLIYLDFKSNLCWDVMDIIKQLLVQNSHDGTVFYINIQMAREVASVMDLYSAVKNDMIDDCNKVITMNNEQRQKLSTFNEMVKAVKEAKPKIEEYVIRDVLSRAPEFKDIPKPGMHDEELAHRKDIVKGLLEDADNFHLVRQHVIRYYVRLICDLYLNYADRMRDVLAGKKGISIKTSFMPETNDKNQKKLIPILRYLALSLNPYYFTQVMYKNKSNKPFLSSLFVLKDQRTIFDQLGYEDFSAQIMRAFMVMQFKRMELLRQRNFDRALYISKVLEFRKNGGKTSREIENEARADLNDIRNMYLTMEKLGLVSLKDGVAIFNFVDSNLAKIQYTFDATTMLRQIKSIGKNIKRIDESNIIFSFVLIKRLLARVEKDLDFSVSADEATVIDIESDDDDVKDYIDSNFDQIFSEDIAVETIEAFKGELAEYIDEVHHLANEMNKPMINEKLKGAGLHVTTDGIRSDANQIVVSIDALLKNKTSKEEPIMSENKSPNKPRKSVKELAYEFINNNPDKKAKEIAAMVNDHVKRTIGIDPCITDCQVRAFKYWNRVNAIAD